MGALKVKTGDQVQIISGKDKGKTGNILRVDRDKSRVFVEGLNMVKRHQAPRQTANADDPAAAGGVIQKEGPIHISNVMLLDPATNEPTRVAIKRENGKRIRVSKKSGQPID